MIDLARGQVERGHAVGIIADVHGPARADQTFAELASSMALGIHRVPMSRHIGASDFQAVLRVGTLAREHRCDVLHGHGAKGGAYARLAKAAGVLRVYTPHGGSLHYHRGSPIGLMYLTLEQALMRRTDLFIFESAYGRDTFRERIGDPGEHACVIHNGVGPDEFNDVTWAADATDLLFVGELRMLKGVDVLIDAIKLLGQQGRRLSATIVGDGPDRAAFRERVASAGLLDRVHFPGAMPARAAFERGRLLVIPSRAESLPYIVLEAAAARMPMIATRVGGIAEIFGGDAAALIPPGARDALAQGISHALDDAQGQDALAARLRERVRGQFSTEGMVDAVLDGYRQTVDARAR